MSGTLIVEIGGKLQVPVAENHCAFHIETENNVCSDPVTIQKMEEFVSRLKPGIIQKYSHNIKDHESIKQSLIVETAKEVTGCDSEICVLKDKQFVEFIGPVTAQEIVEERFKPEGPANDTTWLNNSNIDVVLDQWSKLYENFLHIPFQMIDFDVTGGPLHNLDVVASYKNGIRQIGCVVNTDTSNGNGIHWFAVFIDMTHDKKWSLECFDSAGEYLSKKASIHRFLNDRRSKLAIAFPDKQIDVVDVSRGNQLQKSTTECGVFSLWYILSRLNGIPYVYFSQPNATTDKMMYDFRKFLFRHDKNNQKK